MVQDNNKIFPDWMEKEPEAQSFRSIFKWGARDAYKNPSQGFWKVIKDELDLSDTDQTPVGSGQRIVESGAKPSILSEDIVLFEKIVGKENLFCDTYSRLKYSTGKSMEDILKSREFKVDQICDVLLHPKN